MPQSLIGSTRTLLCDLSHFYGLTDGQAGRTLSRRMQNLLKVGARRTTVNVPPRNWMCRRTLCCETLLSGLARRVNSFATPSLQELEGAEQVLEHAGTEMEQAGALHARAETRRWSSSRWTLRPASPKRVRHQLCCPHFLALCGSTYTLSSLPVDDFGDPMTCALTEQAPANPQPRVSLR